ncbi:MAG: RNA methyltransferase, partial [Acidobacteriota bacterium]|nr:RNA methyltransferase [Acidobacteriota bacterium]
MITSRQNRTLKDIRRLRRSKGEHAILEGHHLVAAAVASGLPLATLLATPDYLGTAEGRALTRALSRQGGGQAAEPLLV